MVNNQGAESGIFANTAEGSTGNGGNITIGSFQVGENGIDLNSPQFTSEINLSDRGRINADSEGKGNGGNISLFTDNLTLRENSNIIARSENAGNGGDITIDADFIIAFPSNTTDGNGNDILATAVDDDGGEINITVSEAILGIEERTPSPTTNDINADSGSGINGDVSIKTPDFNSIQGVSQLAEDPIEPDSTVNQACSRETKTTNTLTIEGKGGVPPLPTEPLSSGNLVGDTNNSNDTEVQSTKPPSLDEIIPARGVIVKDDGSFILTPYPTSQIASRSPQNIKCQTEPDLESRNLQQQQN